MSFTAKADNGREKEFVSRSEAEECKEEMEDLGLDVEIVHAETDGGTLSDPGGTEIVDHSPDEDLVGVDECVHCGADIDDGYCPDCDGDDKPEEKIEESVNAIDKVKDGGLDTDPLSVLPGFMVDNIQGAQAVNKRGYAMIAERYGIEVSTEMVQSPWDNEEQRVVMKATAVTDDGKTYNAYGTACAADGDDSSNLIELADTRSQKRAIQWASGFGIVGYQELTGQLEEGR